MSSRNSRLSATSTSNTRGRWPVARSYRPRGQPRRKLASGYWRSAPCMNRNHRLDAISTAIRRPASPKITWAASPAAAVRRRYGRRNRGCRDHWRRHGLDRRWAAGYGGGRCGRSDRSVHRWHRKARQWPSASIPPTRTSTGAASLHHVPMRRLRHMGGRTTGPHSVSGTSDTPSTRVDDSRRSSPPRS